jgi:hypothetical protein
MIEGGRGGVFAWSARGCWRERPRVEVLRAISRGWSDWQREESVGVEWEESKSCSLRGGSCIE